MATGVFTKGHRLRSSVHLVFATSFATCVRCEVCASADELTVAEMRSRAWRINNSSSQYHLGF